MDSLTAATLSTTAFAALLLRGAEQVATGVTTGAVLVVGGAVRITL